MDSGAIEDGKSVRTNVGFSDDKVCGHIVLQNGRHSADLSDCSLSYQEQDIFDLSEQVVQADLTSTASDPKCEPFLGMEFGSAEAAEAFYYIYAKQTGFSVRKSFSRRSRRDDSIIMRSFVCAREGYHSMKISYGDDIYKVAKQALQKAFAEVYAAKYMHKRDQQQLQSCTRAQKISYVRPLPNSPRKRTFAGCIQRSEHDNKKGDRTDACNEIEAAGIKDSKSFLGSSTVTLQGTILKGKGIAGDLILDEHLPPKKRRFEDAVACSIPDSLFMAPLDFRKNPECSNKDGDATCKHVVARAHGQDLSLYFRVRLGPCFNGSGQPVGDA
ncbi:Protein FAR1-RELATED SEQUENCE 12 [Acorus calamus]|uniref:Protein FAR1-RELATED SEQUENCE 12 n=1 Tax=Acorus calamus TaxID=4465 RepID=A0AAV9D4F8_ACOCL|nr:Protein FAR1-RELATED SEQUENCE 12 [Acorus calamus]